MLSLYAALLIKVVTLNDFYPVKVRHPFSRLYSAWNDKFRTFLKEDGKVDFKNDKNNFAHRNEHVRLSGFPKISKLFEFAEIFIKITKTIFKVLSLNNIKKVQRKLR